MSSKQVIPATICPSEREINTWAENFSRARVLVQDGKPVEGVVLTNIPFTPPERIAKLKQQESKWLAANRSGKQKPPTDKQKKFWANEP